MRILADMVAIIGIILFVIVLSWILSPTPSTDRCSKRYLDHMDRIDARERQYAEDLYEKQQARWRKTLRHKIGDGKEPGAPGTPIGKSIEWYETDYPALDTGELIE